MHRVREGRVLVKNPRNPRQVLDVSLRPNDVIAVVYWSRDYRRLLPHFPELEDRGLRPCFHLSLTGYGPPLEQRGPDVDTVLEQFERLAKRYGPSRTVWRYDPIILGSRHHEDFHEAHFASLAERIAPLVRCGIISFLDPYPSTKRGLKALEAAGYERWETPSFEQRKRLAARLVAVGKQHKLSVFACCEADLSEQIAPARCIDPEWIASFTSVPASAMRMAPTRKGCGCAFARDIGAYHTCGHGCVYCYANESPEAGLRHARQIKARSPHLGTGILSINSNGSINTGASSQLDLGLLSSQVSVDTEAMR
ncbi:MAG: hypothetical protein BWY17_02647 [Deltaproteobacteria bacterium ADurb.Bin207]|nr:MAG: hypothetical protein BWY17_02647 [Deltaproteobacteria bacterium ADurb.Bin207]